MKKQFRILLLSAAAAAVAASTAMAATGSGNDAMACSVDVQYKRISGSTTVSATSYVRSFEVSSAAPYYEDFSTATRIREFNASLSSDAAGRPQVAFMFFADVDVFNSVEVSSTLDIVDQGKGSTLSGTDRFFSSVPGAAGTHRTDYTITCAKAR